MGKEVGGDWEGMGEEEGERERWKGEEREGEWEEIDGRFEFGEKRVERGKEEKSWRGRRYE